MAGPLAQPALALGLLALRCGAVGLSRRQQARQASSPLDAAGLTAAAGASSPSAPATVASVAAAMAAAPSDLGVQLRGCGQLHEIAARDRGEPAPFFGRRIATYHLDAGIGEAFAQGVLNSLALPGPEPQVRQTAELCLGGLNGMGVNYDHEKGMHLFNNTPHLWDAAVGFHRRYRSDRSALLGLCMFAGLFGSSTPEPTPSLAAAGGFGLVFEVLESNYTDDAVFQTALCALSDNVDGSRRGAELVANEGGPGNGIRVLLRAMRRVRGRHYFEGNGFGLQYEVMEDINGLLKHDDESRTWRNAFVRGGILEELVALMQDDPNDPRLQNNCCAAIGYLSEGNLTIQLQLAPAAARCRH